MPPQHEDFASRPCLDGGDSAAEAKPRAIEEVEALPAGTRLGEFELLRFIGQGGFSIVYLAWDHSLDRQVALKEYLPTTLAARFGGAAVGARSERTRETFELCLRNFMKEAKALAQFDHPALVKVYRFWEANGTAYMVMPFYRGQTVKEALRAMVQRPDEAWVKGLLAPLTEALLVIHAEHWVHRDIAPDNVLLLPEGNKPLLLDFGAARHVIDEHTQALTVILKSGYTPIEQYAEGRGMKQGPWTDVYALAAVVYWMITGKTPPPAVSRLIDDTCVAAEKVCAGLYSTGFLRAIDRALTVMPEARTRDIEQFRQALGLPRVVRTEEPAPPARAAPRSSSVPSVAESTITLARPSDMLHATRARGSMPRSERPGASLPEVDDDAATRLRPADQERDRGETRRSLSPFPRAALALGLTAKLALALALALAGGALWWWLNAADHGRRATPVPGTAQTTPQTARPGPGSGSSSGTLPAADAASAASAAPVEAAPAAATPAPAAAVGSSPQAVESPDAAPRVVTASRNSSKPPRRPDPQCGPLLQRLSLGESSPELLERLKKLNCQ